jgi:hypothetical protein
MAARLLLRTFASRFSSPGGNDMKRIIKAMKVAPTVMAVALLAACGAHDPGEARGTSPERVDAPERARLEAHAEQQERSAHLQGQARTYGDPAERPDTLRPNPIDAKNRALAERLERSATLAGQARTHSEADSDEDASAPADEMSDEEFVPGSRRMPMR